MNLKQATEIIGSLSRTSKMPGASFAIAPQHCKAGKALAQITSTTCSMCYGKKGNFTYPAFKNASDKRLEAMIYDPRWIEAMTIAIEHAAKKVPFFRGFSNGDFQSLKNMRDWMAVAANLPRVKFWFPTQELRWARKVQVPDNTIIRVSSIYIDGPRRSYAWTSGVTREKTRATCPAPGQGNKCGSCRKCWDRSVTHVDYLAH